jgi:hypothetical protein
MKSLYLLPKSFLFSFIFSSRFFTLLASLLFSSLIMAQPVVSSFSPVSGPGGTVVTINGSGFNSTAAANIVFVGSTPAVVTAANGGGTQLTITIPSSASGLGQLTVLNTATGLSAVSALQYSYTFNYGVSPSSSMNSQFGNRSTMTGPNLSGDYNDIYSCRTSVSGDFDGDGKIDFAARNSAFNVTKTMSIYQNVSTAGANLSSSSLSLATTVSLSSTPIHVYPYPVDFNNDGKLDILLGTNTTNFQVLINNSTGTGNFAFTNNSFTAASGVAETMTAGDFNNDGLKDIAAISSNTSSTTLSIFLNTSSGGVVSFNTTPTNITMPSKLSAVFSADIDNDGDQDLLVASRYAASPWTEKLYYVVNNSSSGTLTMAAPATLGTMPGNNYYPIGLTAGDLDEDGDVDIALNLQGYAGTDSCIWIYRNEGALSFTKFAVSNLLGNANNSSNTQMRIVDMNGDGKKDLLWGQTGNGRYYCVFSQHTGGPINSNSFAGNSVYNTGHFGFSIDDFNQDGKVDIIEPTYFSSTVGLITNVNTVYYSKSTGDLSLATTWNSQTNGLGANASSLTDATKTYALLNRSSYELTSALTINNLSLDAGKTLDLGNYDLTVTAVKGSAANTYIKTTGTGKLKMNIANGSAVSFAVGASAYNPVTITNNSGSADDFSVSVLDDVYASGTSGSPISFNRVKRTWDINKATANGGTGVNFVFNWNSGETVGVIGSPGLYHYGSGWDKQTGTTSSSTYSLTYTGYTGTFSPFAVVDGSTTLPASWLEFTAQKQKSAVLLKWSTASEQHTSVFIIQHSTDGVNWVAVGDKPAAGNSTGKTSYSFIHANPSAAKNFYRLQLNDIDGRIMYSRTVNIQQYEESILEVYPNPVSGGRLNINLKDASVVRLYNSQGVVVLQVSLEKGLHQLSLSGFGKGVYQLKAGHGAISVVIQ